MSDEKTIIRVEKDPDNPFVMMDKRPLNNVELTWGAKGLLDYLLSKPDNWKVIKSHLLTQAPDRRKALDGLFAELKEAGHLTWTQGKNKETGEFEQGWKTKAAQRLAWSYQELPRFAPRRYVWAALACVITTLVATPALPYLDPANIVMLFLLTVVLVAMKLGRGPPVLSAFLSVALFDYFFVPPRFTLAVSDAQYLLTFFVMLAVALIIGHLTSDLRFHARVGNRREERLRSLYEMARDLSGVLLPEQIVDISCKYIERSLGVRAALLLTNERDQWQPPEFSSLSVDLGVAQWAFDHSQAAGFGTATLPGNPFFYLPLRAPMRMRGVLAIEPGDTRWLLIPEQRRQLDGFAALIATALERVHYIEVAQDSLVKIESERLRNSVLSTLSHDLRTPLTVLVGTADSLSLSKPPLGEAQLELATTIRDEAYRMNALVDNLLHMARLQAGEVRLNRRWQPLEEVIGSAIKSA